MDLFTYIITRDFGFAPNPYYEYCTLATCKPVIRKSCNIGDYIAGFGGANTPANKKLVFLMKVDKKLSFDEYWNDYRFIKKRPCFDRSIKECYGDNIYHHNENGEWVQEKSHHSLSDGINYVNLKRDTNSDQVAISSNYWYFGSEAIELPDQFSRIIPNCRGHKKFKKKEIINTLNDLLRYLSENNYQSINGFPFSRNGFTYYKGE